MAHAQRAPGGIRSLAGTVTGTRRLGTSTAEQVTGSNLLCVRDHNQLLVLHTIRTRGASTRRDLSSLTGLTFQTIENISRRLIDARLLEDVPPSAPMGRARQLVLRPAGAHAIGVDVTPEGCRLAVCDLRGRTLAERRIAARAPSSASILDELALAVQDLIDAAEVPVTTVAAVALTVSGSILDAADDARLPRESVRDGLERRLRMPVLCTGRVVAAARGEQWSGRISSRDFIYLHLGSEIGCAVISGGRLCTGARGRGGDIAHTRAVIDGDPCVCGRRGCLHTVLAEHGLRRAFAPARTGPVPPTLEEISRRTTSDHDALAAIDRAAGCLADALLPAVRLLDPEIVMIGGPTADAVGETFCGLVERRLVGPAGSGPGPAVQRARPGAGGAASAAGAVLYETFTPAMDHLVLDAVTG